MACCCVLFIMIGEPFRTVHMLFPCKKRHEGNRDIKEPLLAGYALVSAQNYISYDEMY